MMIKNSVIILLFCLLAGCLSNPSQNDEVGFVFDEEVLNQYQAYDKSVAANKLPLLFESGKTVHNCAEYFTEVQSAKVSEGVNNKLVFQEYLICDTLQLLRESKIGFTIGNAINKDLGKLIYQKLDMRTLRSSFAPMLEDNKFLLKDLIGMVFKVKPYLVELDDPEWDFGLHVMAYADFDNDGENEILAWMYDKSKNSTYVDYQVVVIEHKNGLLVAK